MFKKNPTKEAFGSTVAKCKDDYPKPEQFVYGRHYAITYNPVTQPCSGRVQGFADWWTYDMHHDLFAKMKGCELRLYPETSKSGRIHFHGFIKITHKAKFAFFDAPLLIDKGSLNIKEIESTDDHAEWHAYCLKIYQEMLDILYEELVPPDMDWDEDREILMKNTKTIGIVKTKPKKDILSNYY